MKLSSTKLQHHNFFLAHLAIFAKLCLSTFSSRTSVLHNYVLVAKVSLSADISDAKRLQTQTAPQKGPKTSFEKGLHLYTCLEYFSLLKRLYGAKERRVTKRS